ncbi:hypothetical protein V496_05480 [Pseudogymnoascus sp. VKM F-4515 (FW-2607)]|nr:hypothetical protein V496_05480 [Pseudogymnoascus sp. VKM F-4515 (FW-2607)]KFY89541.1 hypothetical protein V498_06414 [Pseudogymnoascus sp. VKM F-4517 (FW-2822)]
MAQELEIVLEGAVGEDSNNDTEINNKLTESLDVNRDTRLNGNQLFTSYGPPPKGVKYRVEYCHESSGKVIHSIQTDKLDLESIDNGEIFDIVTTFLTPDEEFKPNQDSKEPDTRATPRLTDTRKNVKIHIHSPAIIHALRSIVKYYPGQNLLGEVIVIPEPFSILVHYEKELNEYKERCRPSRQTHIVCPKERGAYHEINMLQEFLEHSIMPAVRIERQRNEEGMGTFDMMWLRLRPGATIKFTIDGSGFWHTGVIEYVKGANFGAWRIGYWTLDYEGTYLGQRKDNLNIDRFEGEQETYNILVIDDLAFKEPLGESVKDFVEQGEKFYNLLSTKCQYYNGTTYQPPNHKINGLVMVDMNKYYAGIDSTRPDVSWLQPAKSWITDCSCFVCRRRNKERSQAKAEGEPFEDYHGIYPKDNKTLTPHQYFLLPPKIWAFIFKTRTWEELHVKSLQEPKFEQDMIDKLVMDAARIKILKALASSYIREDKHGVKSTLPPWSADFIQGKGQGQIILLHGRPGVGKTCTAECIAEYTKRPLMVLTSSDIGANPEKIEHILSDRFKTASTWGAVLLIDEADVFMERRSSNDLNRNSLVAGFLRALEFYDGILFLTTNRVGAFDDAFISRIHVKLYYPGFTDEERQKVWQTFIDKLIKDRGKTIRVSIDAKDFIKGKQIREVKWNGREIRNAFQTAVALAEYDAETDDEGKILLKDTHLSSIVDLSKGFKKYLDDTHGADEDKRATIERMRHDRE